MLSPRHADRQVVEAVVVEVAHVSAPCSERRSSPPVLTTRPGLGAVIGNRNERAVSAFVPLQAV